MSGETRDPRCDPRPGDVVLWRGSGVEMTVTGIRPDTDADDQLTTELPWVQFTCRRGRSSGVGESTIELWTEDGADFAVVTVAPTAAKEG